MHDFYNFEGFSKNYRNEQRQKRREALKKQKKEAWAEIKSTLPDILKNENLSKEKDDK